MSRNGVDPSGGEFTVPDGVLTDLTRPPSQSVPSAGSRIAHILAFAVLTVIVPIMLATVAGKALEFARILNDSRVAANKDFVSYWAAGKLLRQHANPYDSRAAEVIERAAGYKPPEGATMRNPPFAIPLVAPLGWLSLKWAALLWLLAIVGCIATAVSVVWLLQGRPHSKVHLLGFVFPAGLCCLGAGQLSAFALLGVALFLYLYRPRPFLAGVALALCALKPHLFLPFGAVVFCWIVVCRQWKLLLGAVSAFAFLLAISASFRQPLWSEYFLMLTTNKVDRDLMACAASLFRLAINPAETWLQFVPAMLSLPWALWYFLNHRSEWNWQTNGPLLLLVSLLVAPYSWFFDEIVVLPAILLGIYGSPKQGRSMLGFGIISCIAAAELLFGVPIYSASYLWTSAAWLSWYVFETSSGRFHSLPHPATP